MQNAQQQESNLFKIGFIKRYMKKLSIFVCLFLVLTFIPLISAVDNTTYGYSSETMTNTNNSGTGIIIAVVSVMFLFGLIGFKLLESAYPQIGYLLLALSGVLSIVSLFDAYLFTQSLANSALSTIQFGVFNAVFIVLSVIFLLIIVFILYNLLKNFMEKKEQKKYGEGYNTKSKQYEY